MGTLKVYSSLRFSIDSLSPRFESFPENMRPDPIVKEIEDLRNTPAGWDYGRGVEIQDAVVRQALQVYESTYWMGFKVRAFPRSDGGVSLSYSIGDTFLDVIINPDMSIDLVQEKGIGEDYEIVLEEENVNLNRPKTLLNLILSSECPSLELYIKGSTIQISDVSKVIVSHQWKEEYPFSMPIAPLPHQEQYVSTYEDSMNQQLVLQ